VNLRGGARRRVRCRAAADPPAAAIFRQSRWREPSRAAGETADNPSGAPDVPATSIPPPPARLTHGPRHRRTCFRKDAEARFPIKIDMRVPPHGETWPYADMLAWCRANVAAGAWEQHGFMEKKRRDDLPRLPKHSRYEAVAECSRSRQRSPTAARDS
jgi:hypothetical protein